MSAGRTTLLALKGGHSDRLRWPRVLARGISQSHATSVPPRSDLRKPWPANRIWLFSAGPEPACASMFLHSVYSALAVCVHLFKADARGGGLRKANHDHTERQEPPAREERPIPRGL